MQRFCKILMTFTLLRQSLEDVLNIGLCKNTRPVGDESFHGN
jgi:hypothetical protein